MCEESPQGARRRRAAIGHKGEIVGLGGISGSGTLHAGEALRGQGLHPAAQRAAANAFDDFARMQIVRESIACEEHGVSERELPLGAVLWFGLSLGSSELDKAIYATASVAADFFKVALPLITLALWQSGRRVFAASALALWCCCVAWSLSAATGFASLSRSQTVATSEAQMSVRQGLEAKVERTEQRVRRLASHRSASVVQAEIDGLLRIPRSEGCKVLNGPITRRVCPEVDRLRKELAMAKEAKRLEKKLNAARNELATLPVVGQESDPQAATLSRITGLEQDTVRAVLVLLLAVLVEAASALGFTIVALAAITLKPEDRYQDQKSANTSDKDVKPITVVRPPLPLPIPQSPKDAVSQWALMRLDIDPGSEVQARDAYRDFARWCHDRGVEVISETMFGRRFTEHAPTLGSRKEKRRTGQFYVGVALQRVPAQKLAA